MVAQEDEEEEEEEEEEEGTLPPMKDLSPRRQTFGCRLAYGSSSAPVLHICSLMRQRVPCICFVVRRQRFRPSVLSCTQ